MKRFIILMINIICSPSHLTLDDETFSPYADDKINSSLQSLRITILSANKFICRKFFKIYKFDATLLSCMAANDDENHYLTIVNDACLQILLEFVTKCFKGCRTTSTAAVLFSFLNSRSRQRRKLNENEILHLQWYNSGLLTWANSSRLFNGKYIKCLIILYVGSSMLFSEANFNCADEMQGQLKIFSRPGEQHQHHHRNCQVFWFEIPHFQLFRNQTVHMRF